jgi:ADP-heptose:LPS heptosyltransferase
MRRVVRTLGVHEAAPWAVVHPGATASSRRYPPEAFAAAARRLVRDVGCTLVFTGTDAERGLVAGIQRTMGVPSHSLAGALDVAELAALIALAPVLIANNTGPVHLAAAVGTPVVDLYALTNPQHTPWKVANRVLFADVPCKYCYKSVCPQGDHACLRQVPPDAVVAATEDLLREAGGLRCYAWPTAAASGSPNSAG